MAKTATLTSWSVLLVAACIGVLGCKSTYSEPTAPSGSDAELEPAFDLAEVKEYQVDFRWLAFLSPTGNVACIMLPAVGDVSHPEVRCDVRDQRWTAPNPSDVCHLDYGHAVSVADSKSLFLCAGDTVFGEYRVLPDGESLQSGSFFCDSESTSVRCANSDTGHGFELSQDEYRLF